MAKLAHTERVVMFRPKQLQNKFEDFEVIYSESASDKGALTSQIAENIHELCDHGTGDNAKEFKFPLVVVYYDVDYAKNVKGTISWRNRVLKVGQDFSALTLPSATKMSS